MSLYEVLKDDEAPPMPVEIIPEVTGAPAFTLFVKQLAPTRLQAMQDKMDAPVGGQRRDPHAAARRRHGFLTDFAKEVLEPRWENATHKNLDVLFRRSGIKLSQQALDAIQKNGGELPFSIENVVTLMEVLDKEDFESPIWMTARYYARERASRQGEEPKPSEASA